MPVQGSRSSATPSMTSGDNPANVTLPSSSASCGTRRDASKLSVITESAMPKTVLSHNSSERPVECALFLAVFTVADGGRKPRSAGEAESSSW